MPCCAEIHQNPKGHQRGTVVVGVIHKRRGEYAQAERIFTECLAICDKRRTRQGVYGIYLHLCDLCERLAAIFWPESDRKSAQTSLRVALCEPERRLRRPTPPLRERQCSSLLAISWRLVSVTMTLSLAGFVFLALSVCGLVNVFQARARELPLIGKINLFR